MLTPKRRSRRKSLWRTVGSVGCLLVLSLSVLSQTDTQTRVVAERTKDKNTTVDANAAEAQRRSFATSTVISLATDARSYKDLELRSRVLARAADALWEADNTTARALFLRAWDAAEAADSEDPKIDTKRLPKGVPAAFIIGLKKLGGNDLRVDVLSLASHRDRALGEQFLAKLKLENARTTSDPKNTISPRDVFSAPEASQKRLLVANKLLAAGEVKAAKEFAALALTEVNAQSIGFLSELRVKDATTADMIFADLLARTEANPMADANTISGLSSYAFTPGFYIVFMPSSSPWTQPEGPTVAPNLAPALRLRFFQVTANVLLRPLPPPDQDTSSCGRRGRLMVITRLLPLFEQYMPETAAALRAQLTAKEGRNIDPTDSLLSEGIRPENFSSEVGDIDEQLGRARSSQERDEIYAATAARIAATGNKRAREFADAIEKAELRAKIRNYVDLELIKSAIRKKDAVDVVQLAGAGELNHIQRSWSYTQAARLLLESDRDGALDLLEKATDEAERINADDGDASFALINVANQFLAIDHARAWEVMNKTVKFANSAEDFTGDDIHMPSGGMIATRNGARFIRLPDADFNFSRVLRALAQDDLFRSIELAKGFKYDATRAYATLAIARAVLEKPIGTVAAKN
ncbi:MAG TPA: hypothetical protein VE980_24305 [Pyrinomonadaceae bacterium]|nr:hypothetical protein [Pyrinomonadaceae bacterium]